MVIGRVSPFSVSANCRELEKPRFGGYYNQHLSDAEETDKVYMPDPSPVLMKTIQGSVHKLLNSRRIKVRISKADIAKLDSLINGNTGTILVMNHSSDADVPVGIEICRQTGMTPTMMGAVELFQSKMMGLPVGKLLPKIGGISVNRGARDKDTTLNAAKATVRENKYPLGLCPEGFVTQSNRLVLPIKNGAAHIALDNALRYGQDVNIVPLAVYYHYTKDLTADLRERIKTLETEMEKQLDTRIRPAATLPGRIDNLFELMVRQRQLLYHVPNNPENPHENPHDRLDRVMEIVLDAMENRYLQHELDTTGNYEIRARRLIVQIKHERKDLQKTRPSGLKRLSAKWRADDNSDITQGLAQKSKDIRALEDVMNLAMYPKNYPLDNQDAMMQVLVKLRRDIVRDDKWIQENPYFQREYPVDVIVTVGEPIATAPYARRVREDGQPQRLVDNAFSEDIRQRMQETIDRTVSEVNS